MSRVRMAPDWERRLLESPEMVAQLQAVAETVAGRVAAPWGLEVRVQAGDGPRGPYSQVQLRGPGALAAEFGTRRQPPRAPLRRAVFGGR